MLTLGIETSCDETSCAVLEGSNRILSNVVSSSLFRHKPFGGVVPEIASRHCLEQMDIVFKEALDEAGIEARDLDLIGVTEGPGLIGSLLVGVCFAKALSYKLGIPLAAVNHLEAHLEAPFLISGKDTDKKNGPKKPARFIGLLVSGGHTILTYHEKDRLKILGQTVDDAVGEAYDKVAKILKLGYPGGPILDRLAREGNPQAVRFTKPKQKHRFDFSFSGIKTAVLYYVQARTGKGISDPEFARLQRDIAASFQHAVVGWLVDKTLDAALERKVKDIVVGGGVSANSHLRKRLSEEAALKGIKIWFPDLSLSTDNAAMIAKLAIRLYRKKKSSSLTLSADANLRMKS